MCFQSLLDFDQQTLKLLFQCHIYISAILIIMPIMATIAIILLTAFSSTPIGTTSYLQLPLIQNDLGLPILTLWGRQQLLIDTGSEEAWLADDSCLNCRKTTSLCPELKEASKQINYFKGYVKGDYTFVNTSFGSHKVICVKQAYNLKNIQANGILGIRGNSTGNRLFNNYLQTMNFSTKTLSLYYGLKESKLFLGQTPPNYRKKSSKIYQYPKWNISVISIIYNRNQTINTNCQLHFDTGSNLVILPDKVYEKIANFIIILMQRNNCYETAQKMKFYCYFYGIDLNESIVFYLNNIDHEEVEYRLNLKNMVKNKDRTYQFLIDKTDKDICILGIPSFKGYIIQFSIDGPLRLYQSNYEELQKLELSNFKTILCEYVLLMALLCLLSLKAEKIVDQTINRKIVI